MKIRKTLRVLFASCAIVAGIGSAVQVSAAYADNSGETQKMYRMYNKLSGEHLYTADINERETLRRGDWLYEGVGWVAPQKSTTPVYRLYNHRLGDHHYTLDANEVKALAKHGWKKEGIGWYSSDSFEVPLFRQYNSRLRVGSHHYTTNSDEYKVNNARNGWKGEGIAWYAIKQGWPEADGLPKPSPSPTTKPPTPQPTPTAQPTPIGQTYVMNKNTKIIHPANDKHVKRMAEKNKVYITTQADLQYWLSQGARFCEDPY